MLWDFKVFYLSSSSIQEMRHVLRPTEFTFSGIRSLQRVKTTYKVNQIRAVAKCDNLCTLSLFPLKLWLFRLKYMYL